MSSLFGGGQQQQKVDIPPPSVPRTLRMPTQDDPDVLAAQQRVRQAALMRTGRLSTILTDQTKSTTGSSGQKLGA
jgi:hypothetical protein